MDGSNLPSHKTILLHTRRGNVIRLSREQYLRDDIDLHIPEPSEAEYILVFDSETILNQIDSFQNEFMVNVIMI